MPPVVYKFGGTSLGTAESIRKVYDIVHKDTPWFLVVSAVAGITDLLDMFCSVSSEYREHIILDIANKHNEIIHDLQLTFSIAPWMEKLQRCMHKEKISLRDRAEILAIGEDISASLFHAFCCSHDFSLEFLEARTVILTDGEYSCATPDIPRMRENWHALNFRSDVCYITQGFIGANAAGETTLLGRGGSDYSGALIAEMSHAKEVRIYTDVNGIYTMDPRIIEDAQLIPELSFEEMQNLATFGAKILYPPMLSPCVRSGIPIFVTSTFDLSKGGTWIYAMDKIMSHEPRVKALSLRQHQRLWSIDCSGSSTVGLDKILSILDTHHVLPGLITSQDSTVSFTTDDDDVSDDVIRELYDQLSSIGTVHMLYDLALITMIGSGLASTKVVTTVTEKLRHYPSPIFCCCQSCMALSLVVPENLAGNVVEQLHNDYVKQKFSVV
ncbi:aspartate kinase [Chlamydia abortus]|uniref:aspartate kinase n=1 Tax=Chlamydia abortus TaxID=83555 RepID=UPI000A27A94E|nr:aspartate kinase [Chlamydia abortus]SGA15796.1 aspartate kinase [Chlamydia abortus]SGA16374.1 aspartate kinase [Chlamydia abortus]SGW17159.1 aspartate kinase [Chlamydia abortus]